ncbi:MAG TPA: Rid family detoxifying hydrolase [Thermoanaerobaculia bacterium]|nr:Rid family detoxifying hydrolase [Thermoanaerobaculia bacterium]
MRDVISTPEAPSSIGPFSQAIRANGFVFVSGQVALDPSTQKVIDGDVAAQTERTLENVSAILRAAGSDLSKVVRSGVYLRNMGDFAAMNAVYARYFPAAPPARTTIEVSRLPLDVLVEVDVVALV